MTDLSRLIRPRSIALIGASDRQHSIGERTLSNLLDHSEFDGPIYLVNPGKAEIRGHRCWPSVAALPATPDLAVIVVPASGVLTVAEECAARGVPFAIVLTSGSGRLARTASEPRSVSRKSQTRVACGSMAPTALASPTSTTGWG